MSIFIDRSFLLQLSPKLVKFTKKKDDLYNFRCPLCGDSQKNKHKCRGYVYRKGTSYFYMCHNCGASTSFYNFLKQVDPNLVQKYSLEKFKATANTTTPQVEVTVPNTTPIFRKSLDIPRISDLPAEHFAKMYVMARQIPTSCFSNLYYAEDFKAVAMSLGIEKGLIAGDQRLVIPFHDKEGNITGIQGRSLGDSKLRYITLKIADDVPRIYGMDRVNIEDPIYVFEGPIDSMFIKNSIAVASSALESAAEYFDKSKIVLVYDNEPRNKEIVKLMEHSIDHHFNVVVWPDMIQEKDVNDMVLSGFQAEELQDIMEKHTFVNLRAKMDFVNWKKV